MAFDRDKFWAHVREPIATLLYAGKMRKGLKNKDFTILSCNCAAGILYHRYNHPFLSPTINLWIEQNDFLNILGSQKHGYCPRHPTGSQNKYLFPF